MVIAPANPNVTRNPSVMNVADFAFPDEGNPSLNNPETSRIIPMYKVSSETACIPSMKVLAIPESEIPTPTIPMEVSPIPGVKRSQSLIVNDRRVEIRIINLFLRYTSHLD
jgi:hypothetical protein